MAGISAVGLAGIALAAMLRLGLWWLRASRDARSAPWRLALLLAAQPTLAVLLFAALFPSGGGDGGGGALVVAARGAPPMASVVRGGERLVVLPEAPAGFGGEAAPDLATALRRHPGVTRLRVVGVGLEPRDLPAAAGRALTFDAAPLPRGFVELHTPEPSAPGAQFTVAGRTSGAPGGHVELLDPAGHVASAAETTPAGGFTLTGVARDPGPALWAVRLLDQAHVPIEVLDVPQVTIAPAPVRVLLLAGAAGPEVKALRRWADGAGVTLRSAVAAGGGLELGDPRPPLTAATLGALDLLVVDERSWAALGGAERDAVAAAVRGGLGLLMRVTGPIPPEVRDSWRRLGFPLSTADAASSVNLAGASTAPASGEPPDLTRLGADTAAPLSTPLLRDAAGAVLARSRPLGAGRLGVWTVDDSSGLVTAGFGDLYGRLWSRLFAALSRADRGAAPVPTGEAVAGRRLVICGLRGDASLREAGGAVVPLLVDPRAGEARCAAAWPREAGWLTLRSFDPSGAGTLEQPLYVRPAGTAAGLLAGESRTATAALASASAYGASGASATPPSEPPSYVWLLAWLALATAVWLLERSKLGRPAT